MPTCDLACFGTAITLPWLINLTPELLPSVIAVQQRLPELLPASDQCPRWVD